MLTVCLLSVKNLVYGRANFIVVKNTDPRAGEVGLDVGCGAGHLACELARDVAPGGRIIAIDKSPDSVDASTRIRGE